MNEKKLSLMLSVSMMLGLFAGCSTTTSNTTGNTGSGSESKTETGDAASSSEDLLKISYWDGLATDMVDGSYCETLIEDKFPVDIDFSLVDSQVPSQVANLLTGGGHPDVFWYDGDPTFVRNLGITRTIPREMVEEYAPSFIDLYDEYPTIYTSIMDYENTDEFYALNGATDQAAAVAVSLYADYYRYDWIEALGLDLGMEITQITEDFYVADRGPTLEEFQLIMDGFTNGDPDGNGVDDTYGASFEYMYRFDLLYSAFGMVNGVNEFQGEAEMFYAMDNFKEFAIWFQDLFAQGYIDENFLFQDRSARWDQVNQELCGYFLESSIAVNSWASDRPPLSLLETNPDAKFLITPGLSDEEGNGTMIKNAMPTFGRLCYISDSVDDETLILILQMLEYINFGEDTISFWFGEENVDWKYNDEGKVEEINVLASAEKGARIFVQNVQIGELFEAITFQEVFEAGRDFWLNDCIWREDGREQYQYKLDLLGETEYKEIASEYSSACIAVSYDYFERWVYDGLDVEDSWQEYLEALEAAGYHLMMSELDDVEPLEEMILNFISD